jgi:type IV pilus assembly protein PilM
MSFFGSLFGKESVVGIDIGSHAIKAVQIEPHRFGWRVVRAGFVETPEGAVHEGSVVDPGVVSAALAELFKMSSMAPTTGVLALAGPSVAVRQLRLPRVPDPQLARLVRYEAAKHLPNSGEDSAIAYEVLGPSVDDPRQSEVMLVAAPRNLVDSRVAVLDRLGLDIASVDLEAFAAQRAIVELDAADYRDQSLRALVDIGASHTEVTLISGEDFVLTRSVPIAGNTFSSALVQHYGLDPRDAESRKQRVDMSVLVTGSGSRDELELAKIVQVSVDDLLREIRRSIQFFQSQLSETGQAIHLAEILLTGGASQMRGLPEFVAARLGIPSRLVDPMLGSRLLIDSMAEAEVQRSGPSFGIALGLALKEANAVAHAGKR